MFETIRSNILALPSLAKFAVAMTLVVGIPPLSRRVRLPPLVGLILSGVVLGPHGLGIFGEERPVGDFFADLGKLLLMFFAGLEMDLQLFQRTRHRSILFGLSTTALPFTLGMMVCSWNGYGLIPAMVMGSLMASHTLLGSPIIGQLGASRLEPMAVTVGATILSDALSLVFFSICVATFRNGFSMSALTVHLIEIAAFVPLILVGLSRAAAMVLAKLEDDEDGYFVVMLAVMAVAAMLAEAFHLPGITGAFMAGLSVNAAVRDKPAKEKLKFFGYNFFIPVFFIVTGFLIDPRVFARSTIANLPLVAGIIAAVFIGKWIAAALVSRAFDYGRSTELTIWSLTLPQVASTVAAALVGYDTLNRAGQRLIDHQTLNAVLVLMLITSIVGPILTHRFAPAMLESTTLPEPRSNLSPADWR